MARRLTHAFLDAPRGVLWWAIAFSVTAHLSLIALTLRPTSSPGMRLPAPELELVLVNAQTQDAPLRAQVLAQVNLNGGGTADTGRALTPLAPSLWSRSGDALEETRAQLSQLENQQTLLLSQIKRQLHALEARDRNQEGERVHASSQEAQKQAMVRLIGQIERRIEMESVRPKRQFAQVAAQQSPAALYFDRMRQVLEVQGTRQFPSKAGRRLYGRLIVEMVVEASGRVSHVQVLESSGQPALDAQAVGLARRQQFGPFDPALRQQADQLVVVSTFRFLRDDRLVTDMGGQP